MKNNAPFQYFETNDRGLLAQYVDLRRRAFLNEYPWLSADFGAEDETDRTSHIVVAVRDNHVGGGGRLTISTPELPRRLPLEEGGFSLGDCGALKHLALGQSPYAEISRMAVEPGSSSQGRRVSLGLALELCLVAARAGIDTIFSICPDGPAKINQLNARILGVTFRKYDRLPTVYGKDMWLCCFTGVRSVGSAGTEAA